MCARRLSYERGNDRRRERGHRRSVRCAFSVFGLPTAEMNKAEIRRPWYWVSGAVLFVLLGLGTVFCFILIPAKHRAESMNCSSYLRLNLGLIAQQWAATHGNRMPTNYDCMRIRQSDRREDERMLLPEPRFWVCPSDKRNPMTGLRDSSSFRADLASYEIVSPGVANTETNAVFFRCKIHGHLCYVDGSVFDGVKRRWPRDD
jgi:hypothetical protein